MDLTEAEKQLQQEALEFIEAHQNELIQQFILDKKPVPIGAFSHFMAGSPGAIA